MASVGGVLNGGLVVAGGSVLLGPMFLAVAQGGTWAAGASASASMVGNGLVGAGDIALAGADAIIS